MELHPLPTIALSITDKIYIPPVLPRNNMSASATPNNAIIKISPAFLLHSHIGAAVGKQPTLFIGSLDSSLLATV